MSLAALRAIRRTWPRAHLSVLVKQHLAGFFDGEAAIDEVIPYALAGGLRGVGDRRRVVAAIRVRRFDLAVMFPNSFESASWAALARVPRRAGFSADWRSALLTLKAAPPSDALSGHQANYWLAMVRETLGVEGDATDFTIASHEPNRIRMHQWLAARRKRAEARLIALAPAAAYGPAKEWPAPNWTRLVDMLAERDGTECVLVGAAAERTRCEEIAASSKAGAVTAAGETNLGELIALLSLADGFIGNDSGAMHLAGALGIPTVAIFGSTNPARTGPMGARSKVIYRGIECSPCLERTCRFGHYRCLTEIGVEEVAAAAEIVSR